MQRFLIAALMLTCSVAAISEYADHDRHHHPYHKTNGEANGLGAGGTVIDTWGIIYRHHFHSGFGFTTSLGGWFERDKGWVGNELGLLYSIINHHFAWQSMPYASIRGYIVAYLGDIFRYKPAKYDIGIGAGPGAEFFFNRHISVHLELPWMIFGRVENNKLGFRDSHPHLGGGIIYYF
jgi:hypothetical protein